MARNSKREANLQKGINTRFKSGEEAAEKGRKGGIRSGEVRREKAERMRDAKSAARYILSLAATGKIKQNLKEMGVEEVEELTNMNAIQARLYAMAMGGNLDAYVRLMKMAGYDPEENRKERESVAADRRRDVEVEAKVTALGAAPDGASMAVGMGSEDGGSDVTIYIPQMLTEEECQVAEDEEDATAKTEAEETPTDN